MILIVPIIKSTRDFITNICKTPEAKNNMKIPAIIYNAKKGIPNVVPNPWASVNLAERFLIIPNPPA